MYVAQAKSGQAGLPGSFQGLLQISTKSHADELVMP